MMAGTRPPGSLGLLGIGLKRVEVLLSDARLPGRGREGGEAILQLWLRLVHFAVRVEFLQQRNEFVGSLRGVLKLFVVQQDVGHQAVNLDLVQQELHQVGWKPVTNASSDEREARRLTPCSANLLWTAAYAFVVVSVS